MTPQASADECARSACDFPLKHGRYRIWNDPTTELGYRNYCIGCGRRIMEYNLTLPTDQHMKYEALK